jgi:hypothetical protein
VTVNPGGGSGRDEPPLDVHIPDDARELDRDVLAYHRELRAQRRRRLLRKLAKPFAGQGTIMPLLASILAVCLVAGAMLSVATFSPATTPATHNRPSATAAGARSGPRQSSAQASARVGASGRGAAGARASGAGASGSGTGARPSGSANAPARSAPSVSQSHPAIPPGGP